VFYSLVLLYVGALYIRPGEIVPALAGVPIVDYLSIVVMLAGGLSLLLEPRKFWDQPHDKTFILYYFAIVISNPAGGYIAGGQEAFSKFLPIAFTYFLIRLGIRTMPQLRGLTRMLIWLNVFLAFNGLLQVFADAGIGRVQAMDTREGIRIQGTGIFNDPNDLGMTLVMTVPFLLSGFTAKGRRLVSRLLTLAALVTLLLACYYTNSRGTVLGLGAVFAVYAYRRYGVITATVLAVGAVAALMVLGPSRMSTVSAEESSAQGRIQAWAAAYQMFFDAPLTGVGFGRFADVHGLAAHNGFMHVLGELGLIGELTFVALFYWYFAGLRITEHGETAAETDEAAGTVRLRNDLADSCIGMIACICFLSRQYTVVIFILLAIGAAYSMIMLREGRATARTSTIGSLMLIGGVTFVLLAVFYVLSRLFAYY
jgi:putative inorganic carbon (hco3(-)) transporter